MDEGIGTTIFLLLVGLVIWLFSESFAYSEITVYQLYCTTGPWNGAICPGRIETANPISYKPITDQQLVVSWNSDGVLDKFNDCVVRNVKNWSCDRGPSVLEPNTTLEWRMVDGDYAETGTSALVGLARQYRQVPKWRWWLARLREKTR